jgi:hypothetical protein
VIAHLGAPDHDAFVALAERNEGVWLDTAMVFTDPPVRHEALSVPSGGERTPPPGCRGSRVKLRAA